MEATATEMWGQGLRNMVASRNWKGKGHGSPLKPPEGGSPARTLILEPLPPEL